MNIGKRLLRTKVVVPTVLVVLFSLLGFALFPNGALGKAFRLNLANVKLNRLIFPSPADSRTYASLLDQAGSGYLEVTGLGVTEAQEDLAGCPSGGSALIAWLKAVEARYQRNFVDAGWWLKYAAETFPLSQLNLPVMVMNYVATDPQTGTLRFIWNPDNWGRRGDSQPIVADIEPDSQVLTLVYQRQPMVRDAVVYSWRGNLRLPYWAEMQLTAKVEKGAYLTLELQSEKGLRRYVNYHVGNGEWETFHLPLEGTELRHIYIGMSEPESASNNAQSQSQQIQIEPITILLKPEYRTCIRTQ